MKSYNITGEPGLIGQPGHPGKAGNPGTNGMNGKPGLRGKRGKRGKGLKGDTVILILAKKIYKILYLLLTLKNYTD